MRYNLTGSTSEKHVFQISDFKSLADSKIVHTVLFQNWECGGGYLPADIQEERLLQAVQ